MAETTATAAGFEVNDIVQVDGTDPAFAGCLVRVTEVDESGVAGKIQVPQAGGSKHVFSRFDFARVTKVGRAR